MNSTTKTIGRPAKTAKQNTSTDKQDIRTLIDCIRRISPFIRHKSYCGAPQSRPGVQIYCNCDVQDVIDKITKDIEPICKRAGVKI